MRKDVHGAPDDDRLREDVRQALIEADDVEAPRITVRVDHGEVTLDGIVPEREMHRAAEDCLEDVKGIVRLHNRLRVEHEEAAISIGGGEGSSGIGPAGPTSRS